MTDPEPEPGASQFPIPELWRTLGRPGAVATLRLAATGLILRAASEVPPEYRDDLAPIITALSDLADRIQQDHEQAKGET